MHLSREGSMMVSTSTIGTVSAMPSKSMLSLSYIKQRKRLYLSVCTGNLLALSVGLTFAWTSPFLPQLLLEEYIESNPIQRLITSEESSWIASFMAFGAMFGTFYGGRIATKYGRKPSLLIGCALPFIIANIALANAKSVYTFCIARIIAGVAVAGVYTVVPMYLAEIAEDDIRGLISSSMLTFETFGELLTYCIGPYVTISSFCAFTILTTSIVAVLVLSLLPESPYYLLSVNDRAGAEKSMMILRSSPRHAVRFELDFMQSILAETQGQQGTIRDLWKTKAARKAEITTLTLTVFQHCSGIVPFLFYSQNIFKESGSSIPPEYCSMIFGVVQFLSSFVAPSLVDKLGRRWMLFISASGMHAANAFLGLYFIMKENDHDLSHFFWLPVLCLVTYIFSYVTGFGPLIWTIMGELFPTHLKAPAFTVGVCFWWTMAFTSTRVFYPISIAIGMAGTFFMFSGACFCAIIFIRLYVIETKGKSFQEIQAILNNESSQE